MKSLQEYYPMETAPVAISDPRSVNPDPINCPGEPVWCAWLSSDLVEWKRRRMHNLVAKKGSLVAPHAKRI